MLQNLRPPSKEAELANSVAVRRIVSKKALAITKKMRLTRMLSKPPKNLCHPPPEITL